MRSRKPQKKINWFNKTLLILNMGAVLLLLISYLSSYINPDNFWVLAFVGLGYPLLLLVNAIFILYWLFKKPPFSLLSIITILIGWKFLVSTIGFRESTAIQVPKSSPNLIRIMTWNAHYFRKFDEQYDKAAKDQMLDVIRKEQPDVLCIQEFFTRRKGEFNLKKSLRELLKSDHYYLQEVTSNDYETLGMAIFSKFPIKNKGTIVFENSKSGNEAIYADFEFHKKKFRVYSVHLQSIKFQPEDYEYLKNVKEIPTDVSSTRRVGSRLKNAFVKRGEQADFLKKQIDDVKYPVVIAGDFNDTPVSYSVNTLVKDFTNTFREKGSGFGITYNGDFPNFQIDYILVSPQFEVKNYSIIDKKLSDHYPVRSDLELK